MESKRNISLCLWASVFKTSRPNCRFQVYGVAESGGAFVLPFDDEWQPQLHMQHVPSQRQASPQQALQH